VKFQGLQREFGWLGYGERAEFGLLTEQDVRKASCPDRSGSERDIWTLGSVARPEGRTEGMLDGSDAIADWPSLTALEHSAGALGVSVHPRWWCWNRYSIHAGMAWC